MAVYDAHKNFAYSTIAVAPGPPLTGLTATVQAGDGTKFPAVPFNAVVWPLNTFPLVSNAEIVRVTGIAGDVFTFTRTQEGSGNRAIGVNDQIAAMVTAKTLTDIEGVSGSWTPILKGSTTAGVHTYSVQSGYYLRAGRLVVVGFNLTLTAKDAAIAGTYLQLGGLPFSTTISTTSFWTGLSSYFGNFGSHSGLMLQTQSNNNFSYIVDSNQVYLSPTDLTATSYMTGSLVYLTD